jgi:hypothetical protein
MQVEKWVLFVSIDTKKLVKFTRYIYAASIAVDSEPPPRPSAVAYAERDLRLTYDTDPP